MASADKTYNYSKLEELSESCYEIADGQPDIQGWDVRDSAGNKIGEVDELLFDPQARKVRYIIMHMGNNDIGLEDGRVFLPISLAVFQEDKDNVVMPGITKAQLLALPLYEKGRAITEEVDEQLDNVFATPDTPTPKTEAPIEDRQPYQTKFYGKQQKPGADVTVSQSYLDEPEKN
ncbi:PRC-barrel domain-containing protein [Mucilaginibacter psychrotolerans]|uniref:PRC-barrel domain containing protein n=1 Tax=Mucilaginibacter psychrotolerans TaxID=1524096 RepID=A0A4Y8SLZ5_9SPHI|nr:PRC-barrel domain-containing protein [Mucilaginibacter psychrotolerans]TFF39661.1 PRC-barrel domain containing protein [Mucilaginibacter psychrotolerans]